MPDKAPLNGCSVVVVVVVVMVAAAAAAAAAAKEGQYWPCPTTETANSNKVILDSVAAVI